MRSGACGELADKRHGAVLGEADMSEEGIDIGRKYGRVKERLLAGFVLCYVWPSSDLSHRTIVCLCFQGMVTNCVIQLFEGRCGSAGVRTQSEVADHAKSGRRKVSLIVRNGK